MYTEAQISQLLEVAQDAGLVVPAGMMTASPADLITICNGVGCEAMPEKWRNAASKFFSAIEATAAIHDFDYSLSDGSEDGRRVADDRFLTNGIREVYHRYRWWNWRRYVARIKLIFAYDCLLKGGRAAWLECYYQNKVKVKK